MANLISITGDLGSGKSTVSKLLCKRLNYDHVYTGKIQRAIAQRYNMTTLELNTYAETHPEIDEEIDSTFKSLNDSTDLIVDSRLAWFFLPDSFKVFLKTNVIVSANRIAADKQRESEEYASREEAINQLMARKTSENKRYMELYGADCNDLSQFNLLIDTSFITPERVAELIVTAYDSWLVSQKYAQAFISPTNLYPTRSVQYLDNDSYIGAQNDMQTNEYAMNFPVKAAHIHSFDYILDGHKRVSCALKNKIDLIPVVYQPENSLFSEGLVCKDAIPYSAQHSLFKEWEDFHSFSYLLYPFGCSEMCVCEVI